MGGHLRQHHTHCGKHRAPEEGGHQQPPVLRKKMNTECEDFTDRVRVYRVGRDSRNHLLAVPHGIYLVEEFEDKEFPTPS